MNRTQTYQPIKKEFIPLEKNQEVKISVEGLREIKEATAEESQIPTEFYREENGIVPVPIIVNRTETHNSGDVAKQGSVRANLLGIIPFAKKLFSKKESQQMAVAPKPLPEGELVISFYDSAKELLSTETFALTKENQWETLSFSTKAEQKGYISAKIQGTSSEPVKFDDFSIQLKSLYSAKLYQENHYYPFGMNMKGLENRDFQTEQNKNEYRWQYNEKNEREKHFSLFWDETKYRTYDIQLGRFNHVDPKAEEANQEGWTPYHYAFSNPIRYNDKNGDVPGDYYDQKGNYLGTDGKKDGKLYVVTDENDALIIGANNSLPFDNTTPLEEVSSAVELPSFFVRSEMGKAVDASNKPTTASQSTDPSFVPDPTGSFHEEGGYYSINPETGEEKVVHSEPGGYVDPGNPSMRNASIKTLKRADGKKVDTGEVTGTFHVHPSGQNNGKGFKQSPSPADYRVAKQRANAGMPGDNYVLATGNNTVYIFNGSGQVATFPLNDFRTLKPE